MSLQDIGLFTAIGAKLNYLSQRQTIIAQNIANSDTPGYRPQDLQKVDFSTMVKDLVSPQGVNLSITDENHMPNPAAEVSTKERAQKKTYEVAPAGNAVIMEEQLIKSGKNTIDYNLMLNLYQKQVGMIRTALGSGR
jgi:flagellar basal-body rod protein FlgB